jgi:hypothetical protein
VPRLPGVARRARPGLVATSDAWQANIGIQTPEFEIPISEFQVSSSLFDIVKEELVLRTGAWRILRRDVRVPGKFQKVKSLTSLSSAFDEWLAFRHPSAHG